MLTLDTSSPQWENLFKNIPGPLVYKDNAGLREALVPLWQQSAITDTVRQHFFLLLHNEGLLFIYTHTHTFMYLYTHPKHTL